LKTIGGVLLWLISLFSCRQGVSDSELWPRGSRAVRASFARNKWERKRGQNVFDER